MEGLQKEEIQREEVTGDLNRRFVNGERSNNMFDFHVIVNAHIETRLGTFKTRKEIAEMASSIMGEKFDNKTVTNGLMDMFEMLKKLYIFEVEEGVVKRVIFNQNMFNVLMFAVNNEKMYKYSILSRVLLHHMISYIVKFLNIRELESFEGRKNGQIMTMTRVRKDTLNSAIQWCVTAFFEWLDAKFNVDVMKELVQKDDDTVKSYIDSVIELSLEPLILIDYYTLMFLRRRPSRFVIMKKKVSDNTSGNS